MFGTQVHGVRGPDGAVGLVRIVDDASFWTTVVVPSECRDEMHGFQCCIGSEVPGAGPCTWATKADTNLRMRGEIPFDAFEGVQFEWHVPAVAAARFQPTRTGKPAEDYAVRPSDVAAFASTALIRFLVSGRIVVEQLPSLDMISRVVRDDAEMYHQIARRMPEGGEMRVRDSDVVLASVLFPSGCGPKFGNGASIPVILAWRGKSMVRA